MKNFVFALLLGLLLFVLPSCSGKSVAAEVNGEAITYAQLEQARSMADLQGSIAGAEALLTPEELLDQAITYLLISQECRRLGISTSYEDALAETRADYRLVEAAAAGSGADALAAQKTVDFFEAFAAKKGLTVDEYFRQYAAEARRKSMDAIALKEWLAEQFPDVEFSQYLQQLSDQAEIKRQDEPAGRGD